MFSSLLVVFYNSDGGKEKFVDLAMTRVGQTSLFTLPLCTFLCIYSGGHIFADMSEQLKL